MILRAGIRSIPRYGVGFALLIAGCVGHQDRPEPVLQPVIAQSAPDEPSLPNPAQPAKQAVLKFESRDGTVPIWSRRDSSAFFFTAGMTVNADGAPNAYHPDKSRGLDFLANAGQPGNWWALATDTNTPSGTPLIQTAGAFAGYYVSHTSLCDGPKADGDVTKYVDARQVPYIVLPPRLLREGMAQLGDLAAVYNARNGRLEFAVVADRGPRDGIGEGSIALAASLGIGSDLRGHGAGQDGDVVYLLFPGTATKPPWPRPIDGIRRDAAAAFNAWGGLPALLSAFEP